MTQEDKELLFKDLCARLPYGVIIEGLEHPERKEDFQITINKDDELEIYFGNWCYHWTIDEYELH